LTASGNARCASLACGMLVELAVMDSLVMHASEFILDQSVCFPPKLRHLAENAFAMKSAPENARVDAVRMPAIRSVEGA
jgi:hypothetical protein